MSLYILNLQKFHVYRFLWAAAVVAVGAATWLHIAGTPRVDLRCDRLSALGTAATSIADGPVLGIWGWAYDRSGIREIQVATDGKIVGRANITEYRRDVVEALPDCQITGKTGFAFTVPTGPTPVTEKNYEVLAITARGGVYLVGRVNLRFDKPIGNLNPVEALRWNGKNVIEGWAVGPGGVVTVKLMSGNRELARTETTQRHVAVGNIFPAWPAARNAGFQLTVSMQNLPRGRYPTVVRLEDKLGTTHDLPGPDVLNDEPIGKVVTAGDRFVDPGELPVQVWVDGFTGQAIHIETESGLRLGELNLSNRAAPLSSLEAEKAPHSLPDRRVGSVYAGRVDTAALPAGVHRLVAKVGEQGQLFGPIVLRHPSGAKECVGTPRRLYVPGNYRAFGAGFGQMRSWRRLVDGGCVQVGLRGRVEYLRTTRGLKYDYALDPDFAADGLVRNGREMTGVPLNYLLDLALRLRAPLLITLDGGVWADSAFSAPDIDVVDMLEEEPRTVQWNQHGHADPDNALKDLAGSMDSPELARMMSLNRFNARFLSYKKRNLQAAVRRIVAFSREHPEIDITVNLDPDEYINPWYFQKQWFDYNPDTLRQFREWLFHRGPYANGGKLAASRFQMRLSLDMTSRLAGRIFVNEDDVEPPRGPIDYGNIWLQIWNQFKRHLVAQHYEDLATWAVEEGLPASKVYTSQTFILADVAVTVRDRATNWTDQAGVSIGGAKPANGHLGVILYGDASRNIGKPRSGLSLMENIRAIDEHWGVVEINPAIIDRPRVPTNEEAYKTLLETFNAGARFLSPMWGSRGEDQRLHPTTFRSYDAMERTPFEYQLAWWLIQLQSRPAGTLYFPFGNDLVESLDGWSPEPGTRASPGRGEIRLDGGGNIELRSPTWGLLRPHGRLRIEVQGRWPGRQPHAELVFHSGAKLPCVGSETILKCDLSPPLTDTLEHIRLRWRQSPDATFGSVFVDAITVETQTVEP